MIVVMKVPFSRERSCNVTFPLEFVCPENVVAMPLGEVMVALTVADESGVDVASLTTVIVELILRCVLERYVEDMERAETVISGRGVGVGVGVGVGRTVETALYALMRPHFQFGPVPSIGSAVFSMYSRTQTFVVQVPFAQTKAAKPAVNGVAIEVPDHVAYELPLTVE